MAGEGLSVAAASGGAEKSGASSDAGGGWQRGHWRGLSPLAGVVAGPLEWVEPVVVG